MHFLTELQEYLKEHGTIYTVRRFRYDKDTELVFIPGVGGCRRQFILEDIIKYDLKDYYTNSGFETLDDWWNKIVDINPGLPPLHLYKVEVIRKL